MICVEAIISTPLLDTLPLLRNTDEAPLARDTDTGVIRSSVTRS